MRRVFTVPQFSIDNRDYFDHGLGIRVHNRGDVDERIRELRETFVYEDPQALPRVYFATEVHPYRDQEAHDILINNRRPATAVVAEGFHHSSILRSYFPTFGSNSHPGLA